MAADAFGSLSAGAYRKPGTITGSNPDNFTETEKPGPGANTEINHHELTTVYDPHTQLNVNTAEKEGFSETAPPNRASSHWVLGRDYYKHKGMPGEAYLDNSTDATSSDDEAPASDGGPAVL